MRVDEVREARFVIDSEVAVADATLELEIPSFLEPVDPDGGDVRRRRIAVVPGRNEFSVELRAIAAGSGYVIARAVGEDALGRDSVFVTATSGSDVQ
jgi:hypothetical protein